MTKESEYWEEYDAIHNAKSERDARRRLSEIGNARNTHTKTIDSKQKGK